MDKIRQLMFDIELDSQLVRRFHLQCYCVLMETYSFAHSSHGIIIYCKNLEEVQKHTTVVLCSLFSQRSHRGLL